jgi:hypothetical protein
VRNMLPISPLHTGVLSETKNKVVEKHIEISS